MLHISTPLLSSANSWREYGQLSATAEFSHGCLSYPEAATKAGLLYSEKCIFSNANQPVLSVVPDLLGRLSVSGAPSGS